MQLYIPMCDVLSGQNTRGIQNYEIGGPRVRRRVRLHEKVRYIVTKSVLVCIYGEKTF